MASKCGENDRNRHQGKDPILDLILQKYTQTARDSIRGPVALKGDFPQLISKTNIELKNSRKKEIPNESQFKTTNFDGFSLGSFSVGGEKRLCFTEIIQGVLKDVNIQQIFNKRDKLLIFTSKCTPKQLDELKYHEILPWTSTSSNLITKSDAFRLCGALQGHNAPKDCGKRTSVSFEVYHECFGGCIGVFDIELYMEPESLCIKCTECNGFFSTQGFVSHNHTSFDEVHTCHWGFDSVRWRSYLMLVEQKISRELLLLWNSVKSKFNGANPKQFNTNVNLNQDPEFVAYIHSPDQKKAMVSPIESLRNNESRSFRESTSAFRPWSPKPSRVYSDHGIEKPNRFIYANNSKQSHAYPSYSSSSISSRFYNHPSCGCLPSSSIYMDCEQCKSVVKAGCSNSAGLHMLAQKASERPGENVKLEPGLDPTMCNCENCYKSSETRSVELSINEILRKCTSQDMKLTTNIHDLTLLISKELNHLQISQEERIREGSVANQRLQTELQLVKMESEKKIHEVRDTKAHVEQELETLHRERQKEISVFNQMRWELKQEVNKRKASKGEVDLETMQKEILLLKMQLEQSTIDRENLHKQLTWQMTRNKNPDAWTPFPTMARKFSDSDENDRKDSHRISVVSTASCSERRKDNRLNQLSPATKTRRLESSTEPSVNSDIEIET